MEIQIPESGMVKKQKVELDKDVSIIYGYNNSGKTTLLRAIDNVFRSKAMVNFVLTQSAEIAVYIPTNRVIASEAKTVHPNLNDWEEFLNYQNDAYKDYSLHLKRIRDYLFANNVMYDFIPAKAK